MINQPRFTGVKIAVAALAVQEIPAFFPAFRRWKHRSAYDRIVGILNLGIAVSLAGAVTNNAIVLTRGR